MTIEPDPPAAGPWPEAGEITQFVFRTPSSTDLLQRARALLRAAPRELSDSFEQAVRGAGLAS
jgi:hypothetical protein